jgi:hypothetical protein
VCAAFSNATPPTIRTALTISRPQNCERNAPNLLAHYLYLWGTTVVQQAIETEWIFVSLGGLSSSYWCQQDSVFARFTAGLRRGKMYMSCTASSRKPPSSAASHNLLKPCPSPAR